MKRIYQVFGGALGWTLGGPIGAVLGAALGSYIHGAVTDEETTKRIGVDSSPYSDSTSADFHVSILILAALVIKADGRVDPKELDFVRRRFAEMFGKDQANESFKVFKRIIDQEVNTGEVTAEIRKHTSHAMRLQLVHFLFQIAQADGHIHESELKVIHRIAALFYIKKPDFESLKAMFVKRKTAVDYYRILEITPDATEKEIKTAYRKMVKKYHPDKLVGLGDDVKRAAKQKFVEVQNAYDRICEQRGMS